VSKAPDIGQVAPAFSLPGLRLEGNRAQHRTYSLSEHAGRALILAFYPGDDTAVCTRQMCAYSEGLEQFTDLGADVWAVSPQDLESHALFARKHDLAMPLLADTGRTVASAYGITLGTSLRRAVFLIDSRGIVRWRDVALLGLTYRGVRTLIEQVRRLDQVAA
jgi:peroxiredoxin Q/BCP